MPNNSVAQAIVFLGGDGNTTLRGGLVLGASATEVINGNTNDLAVEDLEKTVLLRLDPQGNYFLTGLVPPNIEKSNVIAIVNVGGSILTLRNEDIASAADNRFLLGGNVAIQSNEGVTLIYDTVSKRWRSAGKNI